MIFNHGVHGSRIINSISSSADIPVCMRGLIFDKIYR